MEMQYHICHCGDHALTIHMGNTIDLITHRRVMAVFHQLLQSNIPGVKDIIPAYTGITVVYDIMEIKKISHRPAHMYVTDQIKKHIAEAGPANESVQPIITIPVCYDTDLGIDLQSLSAEKNLSVEAIISIHTSAVYNVYMTGFLPGFAYMGIVDDQIETPRLSKPRIKVPAGSVGIAGKQTGIYPLDSPGGWNIIGQTPLHIFDKTKDAPCLLKPGDRIQFEAISREAFNQQKSL